VQSIAQSGGRRIAVSVKILEAVSHPKACRGAGSRHLSYPKTGNGFGAAIWRRKHSGHSLVSPRRAGSLSNLSSKKAYIQRRRNARLESGMRKKMNTALNSYRRGDPTLAAMEEIQSYCLAHPGSPAAVRRPQLSIRGDLWIALLEPSVKKGIVGIGPSVEAALRAFDAQYLEFLGPRKEASTIHDSAYRARNRAAQVQPDFRC